MALKIEYAQSGRKIAEPLHAGPASMACEATRRTARDQKADFARVVDESGNFLRDGLSCELASLLR